MPTAVPPTPDPDGRAITAIWAQPFTEVPLEIEWCKTPQNVRTRGAYNLDLQRLHALYQDCMARNFPRLSITPLASDFTTSCRKRNMYDSRWHSQPEGNRPSR
jgi:hypothetical protein